MTAIRILHLDSNHPLLRQKLEQAGYQNDSDFESPAEVVAERVANYDGIVIRSRFPLDRTFLEKASQLKFIARVGAGLENIDVDYCKSRNITLLAAPEGNRNAVAEHALGMLLSLFNKLNQAHYDVRAGHWDREGHRGHELDGKTVGIIGYGNTGKAFAKKLSGFDVTVLCHDIVSGIGDANAKQVSLEEIQQRADIVSLHIPLTPETEKMVDQRFIDAFAKPFWLLNTSRGNNVVTADLMEALDSGKILGAGLDVLEYESSSFEKIFSSQHSLPLQKLLASDKVIITPHVAGWTHESHEKLAQVIADKIIALYSGATPANPEQTRVTGIGGIFFKSQNPKQLIDWYRNHLGLNTDAYGCSFVWKDGDGNDCLTQWSPFAADTTYFAPSEKPFMQNFRVANLDRLLEELRASGVTIVGEPQSFDYGKFGWICDPEGNKIELWEPIDSVLL